MLFRSAKKVPCVEELEVRVEGAEAAGTCAQSTRGEGTAGRKRSSNLRTVFLESLLSTRLSKEQLGSFQQNYFHSSHKTGRCFKFWPKRVEDPQWSYRALGGDFREMTPCNRSEISPE